MKIRFRTIVKWLSATLLLLLGVGIAVPYLSADRYAARLRWSLERALGGNRRVEFQGRVRYSLFNGPGFTVEDVVIHEDPAIGIEPIAYMDSMEVRPAIWSLLGGRFVVASISLEGAHVNLAKTGPADGPGRWNFAAFVSPSVMHAAPAIHVRDGRINFKFGDTKSIFYLTETDLDISPPGARGGGWSVYCSGKPARTDRTSQGLGSFTLRGRWFVSPERVDLDLQLERTGLGELTALLRGYAGSVHGTISARLHLGGPINQIGLQGRLNVEDVHRWDLIPQEGQGWPFELRGRLDLLAQQIELQASTPGNAPLPLGARFRASDYLSQPHWAVTVNWDRFPVPSVMELARHMGAQFPPRLELGGTMDGAIGYSSEGSLEGELAFHDTALTIPDSSPVRFERANLVFDHRHVHLSPALVRTAEEDEAQIEADYAMDDETLDLSITSDAMKVASLRAQAALAAVPWLEQLQSGQWGGQLRYQRGPARAVWTGRLDLIDAEIPVAGLAAPVMLAHAHALIDGPRVALDHIDARAGKVAFTGEYRYEPGGARAHHLRLRADTVDAAELEAELLPTLRRRGSLLARALGRAPLPDWLRDRTLDGTVQIDDLVIAGAHLESVRARLLWDAAKVEFDGLQAKLDRAAIAGKLAVNLRGGSPSYKLAARMKSLDWQSGKLDVDGTLETSGIGVQLLASLTSEGAFTGTAMDLGLQVPLRSVAGNFALAWPQAVPRLHLTELNLRTDDDVYTGSGATRDDGRLLILLSSGNKEMRMSGPLAKLKLEESARQ